MQGKHFTCFGVTASACTVRRRLFLLLLNVQSAGLPPIVDGAARCLAGTTTQHTHSHSVVTEIRSSSTRAAPGTFANTQPTTVCRWFLLLLLLRLFLPQLSRHLVCNRPYYTD